MTSVDTKAQFFTTAMHRMDDTGYAINEDFKNNMNWKCYCLKNGTTMENKTLVPQKY